MIVIPDGGTEIDLGPVETGATIGIIDYSRRVTDDFGVTTVVKRGFSRRMSVKLALPFDDVDAAQRELAALRATKAQWIADDRFAWLSVEGFYKDFELDLAVPPLSFCTLTIEGLAETEPESDSGGDPAPAGSTSTLRLVQPSEITAGVLTSSSVAEFDYPQWSAGTTYAVGARVLRLTSHRIYESAIAGNIGHDPAVAGTQWIDIGPTNRWAMFDQALGSLTSAVGSIVVVLDVIDVDAVALLDVTGETVRVEAAGYDETLEAGTGAISFLDLPATTGSVTVTITGSGTVSVGTLLVGRLVTLGLTAESPTAGINDFSRKETDDFGEVTIVERAWAKRMAAKALIRTDAIDDVANRIAAVRALPCLWIGDEGLDVLTVYGFFKDFSIEVGETTSNLSLSVEGLSQAAPRGAPPAPNWPDIIDSDPDNHPKPEDGATVGAPPGTPLGTRPVEDVLAEIEDMRELGEDLQGQASDLSDSIDGLRDEVVATQYDVATLDDTVEAQGVSLGVQGEAIAGLTGSLATLTIKAKAGARNLLKNGGFENGLTNWTVVAGAWQVISGVSNWGTYVETYSTTAPDGYVVLVSDYVPAAPGLPYTLSSDMSFFGANPGGENYLEMQFTGADGFVVPGGYFSVFNPLGAGFSFDLDGRRRITATAPAGTVKVRVALVGRYLSGAPHIAFREIKFENAAYMSRFSQEASVVQTFQALETLDTQYANLSFEVSTQGSLVEGHAEAISGLDIDVATLSAKLSAGSVNLLKNSSFENGFANWTPFGSGAWFTVPSASGWGPFAANSTVSGTPSGFVADLVEEVFPNSTYTASADMSLVGISGGTGSFALLIEWRDAGGGYLSQSSYAYKPLNTGFTDSSNGRIRVSGVAPPGAAKGTVVAYAQPTGGTIAVAARQFKLERGAQMSPWSQEASVFQQAKAISTLDGQYAGLSSEIGIERGRITTSLELIGNTNQTLADLDTTVYLQGVTVSDHTTAISGIEGGLVTAFARRAITLDVNGYITGWEQNNNGAYGTTKFRADLFEVSSPSGGQRTEFSGGNWRVFDSNGTMRTRMGVW